MNNPIWLMTSAFAKLKLDGVIAVTRDVGAQGMEILVFRRDTDRSDHVATHLDYESFGPEEAKRTLETCNGAGLRFSLGSYDNLIGGDPARSSCRCRHFSALAHRGRSSHDHRHVRCGHIVRPFDRTVDGARSGAVWSRSFVNGRSLSRTPAP